MSGMQAPCLKCGSRRHLSAACLDRLADAEDCKPIIPSRKLSAEQEIPAGLTLFDVKRPIREAVPNATVKIPRKIIDADLNCPICLNVICETTTVVECLHRFCADCIQQCLRFGKKECPSCRVPCSNKRQLARDRDFDEIVRKMYNDVQDQRDMEDIKAADFANSANIKVLSEDLKERLKHQEEVLAQGGRKPDAQGGKKLGEDSSASDASRPHIPVFLGENAQMRPPHFDRLTEPAYVGRAPEICLDTPECSCFYVEGAGGCRAGCTNRADRVQCDPETCPCGSTCTNIHFGALVDGRKIKSAVRAAKTGVFNHPKKGWALKAREDISSGMLVEEVTGEMIGLKDVAARLQAPKRRASASTTGSHFLLCVGEHPNDSKRPVVPRLFLDMTDRGSLSRFANHSSHPNCELQIWEAYGRKRVGLFALKEIKKETELTINYALSHVGERQIENHEEGRGKGQKYIVFKEYVDDILKIVHDVKEEAAVMEVHADDQERGPKAAAAAAAERETAKKPPANSKRDSEKVNVFAASPNVIFTASHMQGTSNFDDSDDASSHHALDKGALKVEDRHNSERSDKVSDRGGLKTNEHRERSSRDGGAPKVNDHRERSSRDDGAMKTNDHKDRSSRDDHGGSHGRDGERGRERERERERDKEGRRDRSTKDRSRSREREREREREMEREKDRERTGSGHGSEKDVKGAAEKREADVEGKGKLKHRVDRQENPDVIVVDEDVSSKAGDAWRTSSNKRKHESMLQMYGGGSGSTVLSSKDSSRPLAETLPWTQSEEKERDRKRPDNKDKGSAAAGQRPGGQSGWVSKHGDKQAASTGGAGRYESRGYERGADGHKDRQDYGRSGGAASTTMHGSGGGGRYERGGNAGWDANSARSHSSSNAYPDVAKSSHVNTDHRNGDHSRLPVVPPPENNRVHGGQSAPVQLSEFERRHRSKMEGDHMHSQATKLASVQPPPSIPPPPSQSNYGSPAHPQERHANVHTSAPHSRAALMDQTSAFVGHTNAPVGQSSGSEPAPDPIDSDAARDSVLKSFLVQKEKMERKRQKERQKWEKEREEEKERERKKEERREKEKREEERDRERKKEQKQTREVHESKGELSVEQEKIMSIKVQIGKLFWVCLDMKNIKDKRTKEEWKMFIKTVIVPKVMYSHLFPRDDSGEVVWKDVSADMTDKMKHDVKNMIDAAIQNGDHQGNLLPK